MNEEKYLSYKPTRDVIFVLGAGASNPDGVPLQKEILPMLISGEFEEINNSSIGRIVIDFINDNFSYSFNTSQFPKLEAVFGFIDYFIQQNESLNHKYTYDKLRDIKEYLIKLIHYIVNLRTDKRSLYYHKFWEVLNNTNKNSSVITLNYDTLLEQAFDFLYSQNCYIDYCIPLMNYEKLPGLENHNFWINPREPVKIKSVEEPVPYKVLKVHGSLNWKFCNCCNQVLLTPWDRKIDLNRGKFLGYTYPDMQEYEYLCPIDGTEFNTLIMPPTYLKSINHTIISQLLTESSREIRTAKKIVFVGYSLSDADLHIKALFKKNIHPNCQLIIVNPKKKESLEHSYLSLTKNVTFSYSNFEEMLNDESLLNNIFS